MSVACHLAVGDLLDGGIDGVEEGFGFGCSRHLAKWLPEVVVVCGYGVMLLLVGSW